MAIDSANFASLPVPRGKTLDALDKEFFKNWLSSQMANDVYEDVKVKKIRQVTQPDGTEMLKVDFGYTPLTRAGFTVLRQGIASAMITNDAVVGIVAATTQLRYKELSASFETMADSFRAAAATKTLASRAIEERFSHLTAGPSSPRKPPPRALTDAEERDERFRMACGAYVRGKTKAGARLTFDVAEAERLGSTRVQNGRSTFERLALDLSSRGSQEVSPTTLERVHESSVLRVGGPHSRGARLSSRGSRRAHACLVTHM